MQQMEHKIHWLAKEFFINQLRRLTRCFSNSLNYQHLPRFNKRRHKTKPIAINSVRIKNNPLNNVCYNDECFEHFNLQIELR